MEKKSFEIIRLPVKKQIKSLIGILNTHFSKEMQGNTDNMRLSWEKK